MSSTNTQSETLGKALDQANPNNLADAFAAAKIGRMLSPVKVVFAALAAAAAHDITDAAHRAAATVTGLSPALPTNEVLPAILAVRTCRVTAVGTADTGDRFISDAGGTPAAKGANPVGIATLSDDGKTITFEGTVTGFELHYMPRSNTALDTAFAAS
jgi:hypothetical protein